MKLWKRTLITLVIFLLIAIGFYFIQYEIYSSTDFDFTNMDSIYFIANAFSISAVVCLGSAGLYYTASEGSFDGISYATHQVFSTLFKGRKYPYSFSEYKIKIHSDKKLSLWHFIIVGVLFLAIGGGLFIFYNKINS